MAKKSVLITGAGSGIGQATAKLFAENGFTVILVGRNVDKLKHTEMLVKDNGGNGFIFPCDLTDLEATKSLVEFVLEKVGKIDILINNAGASSQNRTTLKTTEFEARNMVDLNLLAPFFLCQYIVPTMLKQNQGTIINIASLSGISIGLIGGPMYSAVKAGLIHFSKYLNAEFVNTGLRVSCIIPGEVDTDAINKRPIKPSEASIATMLQPEDLAKTIFTIATSEDRILFEEVVITPRFRRDMSNEIVSS